MFVFPCIMLYINLAANIQKKNTQKMKIQQHMYMTTMQLQAHDLRQTNTE